MIPRDIAADGEVPASGTLVLDLGAPASGKLWSIRRATIGPGIPTATITGTARLFVGQVPNVGVTPAGADLRDYTTAFPNPGPWSRWELVCTSPQHVYVTFDGAAGQSIMLALGVEEWSQRDVYAGVDI